MEILSKSTSETEDLAKTVARKIKTGTVIALFGDLGSGKTTFTNFLVKALGYDCRVQSPTFVIHRVYVKSGGKPVDKVHHLDLYRLHVSGEVLELGFEDMLEEPNSLVLIEWPELAIKFLPEGFIEIHFTVIDENTRHVTLKGLE